MATPGRKTSEHETDNGWVGAQRRDSEPLGREPNGGALPT